MEPTPETDGQLRLASVSELADLIRERSGSSGRFVVGLVGAPGSGKSTIAAELVERLVPRPPVIGMDGFHLANRVLADRGLIGRKGAPDTFDASGFVALLERVRVAVGDCWAPRFDRSIEDSINAAVEIRAADPIVLVEGNYLLLDDEPWRRVAPLLDLSVFIEIDQATRRRRLIGRHVEFGRTEAEAARFVEASDEPNALVVESSAGRADARLRLS